uniref:tRNA (adenine(58)-N(1))-methyltransferase non-catalytic subunit TRM6 n=1 Tax=Syphacia muris TaxID=451379 RepID=A0A0N5AUG2_9BILA
MISDGCHAVIQKVGGEHVRICKLTRKQNILIEKLRFQIDGAFNHPFGLFEVCAGKLTHASPELLVSQSKVGDIENIEYLELQDTSAFLQQPSTTESTERTAEDDSKEAVDIAQKRQRVTREEISKMKDTGVSAGELVAKLVDGSVSFAERTVYSQDKYIRRKTNKHSNRVLILKPTIRLIAESYYKKDAERIANLRVDLLSYMLTMSGLHSGSKCLVFEQCLGLLTAAVLERLGGYGTCIHLHRGEIAQSIPCVLSMDFTDEISSVFLPLRISTLLNDSVIDTVAAGGNDAKRHEVKMTDEVDQEIIRVRRADRLKRERLAFEIFKKQQVESILIVVHSADPVDVIEHVWEALRFSGRIVVYSSLQQPLFEVYRWLKSRGAVHVQLSDAFFRSYQVLPDRTHPIMSQIVAGGYVLSGVKVKVPTS